MAIQVKVLKATSAYPQVGQVLMVEQAPRVKILIAKGYLKKITIPVFDPIILDEPVPEAAVLEDEGAWAGVIEETAEDETAEESDEEAEDEAPSDESPEEGTYV